LEVLWSSVEVASGLGEHIARGLIYQSVHAAAKEDRLNSACVLRQICQREEEYKAKLPSQFLMAGCISINSRNRLPPIRLPKSAIRFGQDVPKTVLERESSYRRIFIQAESRDFPRDYLRFAALTRGKSESEAGRQSLDLLDYYRALWNLRVNSQSYWRISSGVVAPINKIVLGPLQTLFRSDMTLIEDKWWHELGYRGQQKVFDVTKAWGDLRVYDKRARAKIQMRYRL
jgi:hypothetical protein